MKTIQDTTQNEAHADTNIQHYGVKIIINILEDDHNSHKNEIDIDIEDSTGENILHFIIDGSTPIYKNFPKNSTSNIGSFLYYLRKSMVAKDKGDQ